MPLFGPSIRKMKEKGDIHGLRRELKNKNPELRLESVRALSELGDVEGVGEALGSDDPKVCVEAVRALSVLKRTEKLLDALKNRNAEVRITAIDALKDVKSRELAQPLFEILLDDADETVQRRAFEALTSFGIEDDGEIVETWTSTGMNLLKKEKPQIALKCFRQAVSVEPSNIESIGSIGAALSDHGSHQDALTYAEMLVQMNPQDARGWGLKGICLFNLGKEEEALGCCQQALEINPKLKGARDIVGAIHYNKGDYQVLALHAQETLEFTPGDIKARLMLSEALALSERLADAEVEAQKALEAAYAADYADTEGLAMIYQQLGILSVMRGHDGALEYFEKSIKANQRDQWMYKVADAYLILDIVGSLMEGTPQERRARLLGLAQERGRSYVSYLHWRQENEL